MDRWTQKQNRTAIGTAQLTALLINCFSKENAEPADPSDFLPFPPPSRRYLSEAESMAALDHFFGAIAKKAENNGSLAGDLANG